MYDLSILIILSGDVVIYTHILCNSIGFEQKRKKKFIYINLQKIFNVTCYKIRH